MSRMMRRAVMATSRRRSSSSPPAFVAAAMAGNGDTAVVDPLNIVIPAGAAIGQVAAVAVTWDGSTTTLTTPTGWSLRSGPDTAGSARAAIFTKTLASGEPGATLALDFSGTTRATAVMQVFSGVTETGIIVGTPVVQSTATATLTLPTLSGVSVGAMLAAFWCRRRSGAPPAIVVPSPYTQPTNANPANNNGTSTNTFMAGGYAVDADGGSAGGEAATTTGNTNLGVNYLIALAAA